MKRVFASVTFVRKVTQGLGAAFAGVILTVSQFPVGAAPATSRIQWYPTSFGSMCRRCTSGC